MPKKRMQHAASVNDKFFFPHKKKKKILYIKACYKHKTRENFFLPFLPMDLSLQFYPFGIFHLMRPNPNDVEIVFLDNVN